MNTGSDRPVRARGALRVGRVPDGGEDLGAVSPLNPALDDFQFLEIRKTHKFLEGKKLDEKTSKLIHDRIQFLEYNPSPTDNKKLKRGRCRVRIGDFRVIYEPDMKVGVVHTTKTSHRKDVYEWAEFDVQDMATAIIKTSPQNKGDWNYMKKLESLILIWLALYVIPQIILTQTAESGNESLRFVHKFD